mmetsp:Transcript_523/g.787  ORF Transcript_523/g.787 Transcript_523/m.787 type:complete len:1071 (-) Transcript_523:157-3369(-)
MEEKNTDGISILGRTSRATARNAWKCLGAALVVATILSVVGVQLGGFSIEVDNKGWRSRGTLIADREMQAEVVNINRQALFDDKDGSVWEKLLTTTTEGYVDLEERGEFYTRKLMGFADTQVERKNGIMDRFNPLQNVKDNFRKLMSKRTHQASALEGRDSSNKFRSLALEDTCDVAWYDNYGSVLFENNVFAVWKVQPNLESATLSAFDKEVMSEICNAEVNTLKVMEDAKVCKTCNDGKCLPPLSLVLLLRQHLDDHDSSCEDLMNSYTSDIQEQFTSELVTCTNEYIENFDSSSLTPGDASNCNLGWFQMSVVDYFFETEGNDELRYTSSFFYTSVTGDTEVKEKRNTDLYNVYLDFDGTDGSVVEGVYDTVFETFNTIYVDELVISDMGLALASLGITFSAMLIHTRSPWLTLMGILQVIFAIPLAYFVYVFIAGLTFFPFLNFIGVFVSAALGADDLFVAVDKFKNARIHNRSGSTEDIAQIALPDAAGAMLLTTSTTMVAFFATCICPVPPILCFAVYCGLMIVFNYVMNIFLVFPALCIYDRWLQGGSNNCLVAICAKNNVVEDDIEDIEMEDPNSEKPMHLSFIHRILTGYYHLVHKFRWAVLAASIAATVACAVYAVQLPLPESTEVRLLPEGHPLENHFSWSSLIRSSSLFSAGSSVQIVFGLIAGDTGKQNNPDTLSKLILDETFDPSVEASQIYLKGFCDRFFAQGIATKQYAEYECAINSFDTWLGEQSVSAAPDAIYTENCNSATALPLPESYFNPCIIAWSQSVDNRDVMHQSGTVRIMFVEAITNIDFRSAIADIDADWNKYEDLRSTDMELAPFSFLHVSSMWWWLDTNQQMLSTAVGAALIAIAFSGVVVLFSSRSLVLTLFSGVCITYVLAATTASLVSLGWELGFLESVCFAILVGISCDFVIHFGHAYIHFKGDVDRRERTKYAVLHMGPSILAAAATTVSSALVMLFCKVVFFTKFAMILLMTIVHATIGSFVIYIVLNDLFGPSQPTKLIDGLLLRCGKKGETKEDTEPAPVDKPHAEYPDMVNKDIAQNDDEVEVTIKHDLGRKFD